MLTAKTMITWFIEKGAEKARLINDSPRTCTLEVVMTRNDYTAQVEPHLEEGQPNVPIGQLSWTGELRGIERIGEEGRSSQTGGGLYRYTILVFKF